MQVVPKFVCLVYVGHTPARIITRLPPGTSLCGVLRYSKTRRSPEDDEKVCGQALVVFLVTAGGRWMLRHACLAVHWRLSTPCICSYRDVAFEGHQEWSAVAVAAGRTAYCMAG